MDPRPPRGHGIHGFRVCVRCEEQPNHVGPGSQAVLLPFSSVSARKAPPKTDPIACNLHAFKDVHSQDSVISYKI